MIEIEEHEAERIIKGLEKGEQQTLIVGGIETTYHRLEDPIPVCKKHHYIFDGKHDELHDCYRCSKCSNGRILRKDMFYVKNGKIAEIQ